MVEIDGAVILFLLLLPALNIIGITLTQFRKRRSEVGVVKRLAHVRSRWWNKW